MKNIIDMTQNKTDQPQPKKVMMHFATWSATIYLLALVTIFSLTVNISHAADAAQDESSVIGAKFTKDGENPRKLASLGFYRCQLSLYSNTQT
ncbi:MAG: hypothetical protein HRT35_10275 [Algicola sp.]|nr:hypothetical protein [Algicola sp.]